MKRTLTPDIVGALVVPGQPHILLASDRSPAWKSLRDSFEKVRKEVIEKSKADLILYYSTQWFSVIGHLFQADPEPSWTHVDPNWHEFGAMPFSFKVDTAFTKTYCEKMKSAGYQASLVNYKGFPVDSGTIVAQKLLNPDNKIPAAFVSCNLYAEKAETMRLGQAAAEALKAQGKKAIVVLISGLSHRFEIKEIDPMKDVISSAKDHEWNLKICELLGEGRLEDVSQCAREFARQANADMGFKGIWWLNALCGQSNDFKGKVYDYQPVWGTGATLAHLIPTRPVTVVIEDTPPEADVVASAASERLGSAHPRQSEQGPALGESQGLLAQKTVVSRTAPEPVGPYPHARREGDFLFLSGIGPRTKGKKEIPGVTLDSSGNIVSIDVALQTRATIENVKTILEESGASLSDVVDVQVFLVDIKNNFETFNKVYGTYFKAPSAPTRTTIGVTGLPTPIAVELKVIARC